MKIKSVTLLKDLPGVKAGTVGEILPEAPMHIRKVYKEFWSDSENVWIFDDDCYHDFHLEFIKNHPDWFKVEYDEENNCRVALNYGVPSMDECYGFSNCSLPEKQAKELFDYLVEKRDEYLKSRCKMCGGELSQSFNCPSICDNNGYCGRCKRVKMKCQSCGEVSHE